MHRDHRRRTSPDPVHHFVARSSGDRGQRHPLPVDERKQIENPVALRQHGHQIAEMPGAHHDDEGRTRAVHDAQKRTCSREIKALQVRLPGRRITAGGIRYGFNIIDH